MTPGNYGQSDPTPGTWPPPPTSQPGVWPPAPAGRSGTTLPFRTVFLYAEGSVPLFRTGSLSLSERGIEVQGKAVPRYEIQLPIIAVCFLVRFAWIIAYLIMEYAVRQDAVLDIPWSQVRRIVLAPRRHAVCLVYDAPNYKGVVKTFSLTTRADTALYEAYAAAAAQYVPDRVAEGKLRAWTSPITWIICAGILVSLVFLAALYVLARAGGR